jgi:hypothetical protein
MRGWAADATPEALREIPVERGRDVVRRLGKRSKVVVRYGTF